MAETSSPAGTWLSVVREISPGMRSVNDSQFEPNFHNAQQQVKDSSTTYVRPQRLSAPNKDELKS